MYLLHWWIIHTQSERERSTGSNLLDLLLFSGWNAYWASLRALIEDPQFLVWVRLLSSSLLQYPHMSMVGRVLSCWTNQTRRLNVFRMHISMLYAVEIFVCCKLYAIETQTIRAGTVQHLFSIIIEASFLTCL